MSSDGDHDIRQRWLSCRRRGSAGDPPRAECPRPVPCAFRYLTAKLAITPVGKRQKIADSSGDDVRDGGLVQHLLQGMGKVLQHDDDLRARVLELMLQLARRVERVDVDHRHARSQRAEHRDRILQQVGHHQCHPIALGQADCALQVGAERPDSCGPARLYVSVVPMLLKAGRSR